MQTRPPVAAWHRVDRVDRLRLPARAHRPRRSPDGHMRARALPGDLAEPAAPARPGTAWPSPPSSLTLVTGGRRLQAALAYACIGWPVFPCRPGQKTPATTRGFLDATTDPERITAWWTAVPGRNLAIATGAPGPDVLDVDVRPSGSGFAAFNQLRREGVIGQ